MNQSFSKGRQYPPRILLCGISVEVAWLEQSLMQMWHDASPICQVMRAKSAGCIGADGCVIIRKSDTESS